jgi:ParB family transcriptional regulator, chromosome partitioning protein
MSAVSLAIRPAIPEAPTLAFDPRAWRDTRWVGRLSGQATTHDLLAGAWVAPEARRVVGRLYAAACADLAQATLGGLSPHSADWERWFAALRATARALSPARQNAHVVRRALYHGERLEDADAPWAHRLRRGFAALLAAGLPEPIPALLGEDLATFQAADADWLAEHPLVEDPTAEDAGAGPPGHDHPSPGRYAPTETVLWPTATLRPNPLHPRASLDPPRIEELAASIAAHAPQGGLLQPLLVTPDGTVVVGHRRLAAARRVGLPRVPVIVRELSRAQQLEVMLVDSVHHLDLSPLEEARGYQALVDEGYTQAAIARAVGVSAVRVAGRLALLDLDRRVQDRVHRGELPVGVAPVLLPVRDPRQQRRLATLAVRRRLPVVELKRLVDQALGSARPALARPTLALPADDDPSGGGLSPTREALLAALRQQPDRALRFGELANLAEATCTACGLASTPAICDACPLADLLRALVGRPAACAN